MLEGISIADEGVLAVRRALETIPAMVIIANSASEVEYISPQMLAFLGWPDSVERFQDWPSVLHPEDLAGFWEKWQRALRLAAPALIEDYRLRRHDGVYRWCETRVQPGAAGSGGDTRLYALVLDVDERKRSSDVLKAREAHFRQILDTLPAYVFVSTAAGGPSYTNHRLALYTGQSSEEHARVGSRDIIHPEDLAQMDTLWRNAVARQGRYENILRLRRADGVYRYFQVVSEPMPESDGVVRFRYGVLSDVDELKSAQRRLEESERTLQRILNAIPSMVWTAAADGTANYLNQRLTDYLGTPSTGTGEPAWRGTLHPDDLEKTLQAWNRCLRSGEPFRTTYRRRRADGRYRWFEAFADPLRDVDQNILGWYGLDLDVDEKRALEVTLRATEAQLIRTSSIATVAELSASIAHEINQPLAAIVSNAEACETWLTNEPPNLERARLSVRRIVRDSHAAAEIVRRMRGLFKHSASVRMPFALPDVIAEVLRLFVDRIEASGIAVELIGRGELPAVVGDRLQIQQVVLNLVRNAIDSLEELDAGPRSLAIDIRSETPLTIAVLIRDNGTGTSSLERIFDPFFTTKSTGMGLGLSVCRSIVEAHGGRISAHRNETRGLTFAFSLPTGGKGEP